MAVTLLSKCSKLDIFMEAAPDAKPERKPRVRMAPITLSLPPELIQQFDEAAARHDRTRGAMLAIAMREWLAQNEARRRAG